jgi:hypothetical protein
MRWSELRAKMRVDEELLQLTTIAQLAGKKKMNDLTVDLLLGGK